MQDEPEFNEVKLYAAYQLAGMYREVNKKTAIKYYDLALSLAYQSYKPRIVLEKFYVVDVEERQPLIDLLVETVEDIESVIESLDSDYIGRWRNDMRRIYNDPSSDKSESKTQ